MWIDSHAHLEMKEFDPDRPQVIQRALDQAVTRIITIGTDLESSCQAVALAKTYQIIWATVGVHPHDAASFNPEILPQLTKLADDKHVVAVGEIGLDFYRNLSPQTQQKETFRHMIQLARKAALGKSQGLGQRRRKTAKKVAIRTGRCCLF